jgi:hypothetical protein
MAGDLKRPCRLLCLSFLCAQWILDLGVDEHRASVHAPEQTVFFEHAQIAAHRHFGEGELAGEVADATLPAARQRSEYQFTSMVREGAFRQVLQWHGIFVRLSVQSEITSASVGTRPG